MPKSTIRCGNCGNSKSELFMSTQASKGKTQKVSASRGPSPREVCSFILQVRAVMIQQKEFERANEAEALLRAFNAGELSAQTVTDQAFWMTCYSSMEC